MRLLVLAALAAFAAQTPPPAAPRRAKKRRPAAAAPARPRPARPARHRRRPPEAPRPTDPTAVTWPRLLAPARWTPPAADALERLLHYLGEGTTGYTTADPPAAVFVVDDALVSGSPADAVFARYVSEAAFVHDDAFWRRLPAHYGAASVQAGWRAFRDQPRAVWPSDPHYGLYRKTLHAAYDRMCRDAGARACARWRQTLLAGLEETEVQRLCRAATADALRKPFAPEPVAADFDDPSPAESRPALRMVPEMRELVKALLGRGFDVWAMSLSGQNAALEAARLYGIHPSRVVGLRQKVVDGKLTAEVLQPAPEGAGLAEAAVLFLGRPPVLAVGRPQDAALLDYDDGDGLRVLLADPASPEAAAAARKAWVVQPPLSPVREPQEPPAPAAAAAPSPEPPAEPAAP